MKRHILTMLLATGTILVSPVSYSNATSLTEAVDKAITSHPEVNAARQNRQAILHAWRQAKAGWLPTVDITAGTGYESSENATTRSTRGGDTESLWRNEAAVTLRQMLFDANLTEAETCQERHRYNSATFNIRETKETTALRAVEAYLDVQRTFEILELQKENVATHRQYLDQIRKRASSGRGAQADVRQAEGRLALAEANQVAAEGEFREAQVDYNEVVGEAPRELEPFKSPLGRIPDSLEMALDAAFNHSPAIKSAAHNIEAVKHAIDAARSQFLPRVDLELGMARQNNIDGSDGANNEFFAMTRLRYNAYRGGADVARVKEQKARLAEAKESLAGDERIVEENVYKSWNDLKTAQIRLTPLNTHVMSSDETRKAYKKQFEIGQRTLLDMLDSEVEFVTAKRSLINGRYAVDFAVYELLSHQGKLVTTLKGDQAYADAQPIEELHEAKAQN